MSKPAFLLALLLLFIVFVGVGQVAVGLHAAPDSTSRHLADEGSGLIFLGFFTLGVGYIGWALAMHARQIPLEAKVEDVHNEIGVVHAGIDRMMGELLTITPDTEPEPGPPRLAVVHELTIPRHRAPRPRVMRRAH